ncbi:MAG: hypothetical protein RJB24_69 [Candidatus Parcubacteria bacterium]
MRNSFESVRKYDDNLELSPDSFRFQSAGKKYINQNYKRIGHVLGVEGEWLGVIKRRANSENRLPDIHGDLSLKQINFYREHYDFPPLTQDEYEAIKAQNTSSEVIKDEKSGEVLKEVDQVGINLEDQEPIPTGEVVIADIDAESQSYGVEVQGSGETDQEAQTDVGTGDTINEPESVPKNSIESSLDDGGVDDLFENLPKVDALQAELDRLIEVEAAKLQKEEIVENLSYKVDREKLETFKENARQAIANYQQFSSEHSSLADKSNPQIQEKYQLLEKQAWNSLYSLAHLLDGEIAVLPQDRDIQLSHPEGVDTRQYLESMGYKFDENGDITHVTNNGVEIELNRAMNTEILIKSRRPSHIVYDKSISLDNDFNYQGYLVRGLNQQTPDFIVGVLDKNNLENVIVDETGQSISKSDASPATNPEAPEQAEGGETTPQVSIDDLRLAYAKAEEAWNRKRGDEDLKNAFELAREAYNEELERVLKLQVVEGQESNIHQMFKDEVIALRESRTTQSQELQGVWEQRLNPIKEKFVNFVIKNKKFISRLNLAAGVAGVALASTGAGIPLAGGLAVARRMVSATLLGVSTGEGMRSLGEDADINSFWGKIKFQAIIPKLVQESLASSEDEFKKVSEDILKERLGTLEAYYRLNGGKFTNDNQQQAYEKVLTELARRVQKNVIYAEQNQDELQSDWQEQKPEDLTEGEILEKAHHRWDERNPLSRNMRYFLDKDIQKERNLQKQANENWKKLNPEKYTSELLNTISDKRVAELDKFRRNRKIATGAGIAVGLLAGGAVHIFDEVNKTDSVDLKDVPGAGPGGAGAPDAGGVAPPEATPPPAPELPSPEEALRQVREAAATAEQAQELARDVSSLDSGETIWGEIAEQLGENASQGQIQQAVENYLQSELGQESIYKLAQGTEGGRALLAQWGIDNADAMASLSKDQLFEISRYLAPGELEGITELSIDNLDALSPAEYVELSPVVEPTVESASTEPPAAPSAESPVEPSYSELPPVETTEFTRSLSEALGTTNLTEAQLQEVIHSFATSEQGSVDLYNQIISNEEGARFLSGFGVNNPADFTKLTPDQIYEIAQTIGVENLDQLQGFELNEIILSKFEDAPDMVELVRGTRPLDVVQRYIANEVGSLPYDTNLGKQVLDTYLQTDSGKQWLYDSIVSNPNPNNQNVQLFREYLSFKGIKSVEDFKELFNWAEFSGNRNIPTSGFWNQIRLPNGGTRLQPLSTFLQPSQMLGIKDAVRQVLTR